MSKANLVADVIIRRAGDQDRHGIWSILEPVIRAADTYALPADMDESSAIKYWVGNDRQTFVAEEDGHVVGTYYMRANQMGGGAHVANCGYATAAGRVGRGIAGRMCEHSIQQAGRCGFTGMQFNFVVSSNVRAIALWTRLGFRCVGRVPDAFRHADGRFSDALTMYRTIAAYHAVVDDKSL